MKILVTGGSGCLGSHVVENLLNRGIETRVLQHCLSRNADFLLPFYKGRLEIAYGDIRNPDTCLVACKGVDSVIHLAAAINVDESRGIAREYFEHNVLGTFNVLEACRVNDVKRVTYMSTFERFGNVVGIADEHTECNPSSPYAASKVSAELYCKAYALTHGIPYTIPLGSNFYGPRQRFDAKGAVIALFGKAALRGEPLKVFGSGEQTRDYVYAPDTAEGVIRAHLSDAGINQYFVIASGKEQRIIDIAKRIIELTNSKSEIIHVPKRPGENLRSCGNPGKALRLLGWRATTSFEVGLRETMEYYKQNQPSVKYCA